MTRHFLSLMDLAPAELAAVLARAIELKAMLRRGEVYEPLRNKILAMIFDKSSTRTRVSFEAGMTQFGGNCMFLSPRDTQLGRGEPLEDTARVLSRMVDVIVIRTHEHAKIETFARHSRVPVINALTDMYHPCQLLADIQTFIEHRGAIHGRAVAWVGDGNNVCHSWMNAARQFGFTLRLATPKGYEPNAALLTACAAHVQPVGSPAEAVRAADIVVTDTWASMGQEEEKAQRLKDFTGFRVDAQLMKLAHTDALPMHCLPAHRGQEITDSVIDSKNSIVYDQAENRMHTQKALMALLM